MAVPIFIVGFETRMRVRMTLAILDLCPYSNTLYHIRQHTKYPIKRMLANYDTHICFPFGFPFSILACFTPTISFWCFFFSLAVALPSFIHLIRFGLIRIDSIQFNSIEGPNERKIHHIPSFDAFIRFSYLFFCSIFYMCVVHVAHLCAHTLCLAHSLSHTPSFVGSSSPFFISFYKA